MSGVALRHPRDSQVVVLGAARDVGDWVDRVHRRLQRALVGFKSVGCVVVESYSTDDTLDKLREIEKRTPHYHFFTLSDSSVHPAPRTVRIAEARNAAQLQAQALFPNADFVLVTDLDTVNLGVTQRSVESCWQFRDWDMMSANQPLRYYDVWALRHPVFSPDDCWNAEAELRKYFNPRLAHKVAVRNRSFRIPKGSRPIPVTSAFGGLAVYRSTPYMSARYSGINEAGEEVCEHVPFHEALVRGGYKLFINAAMMNVPLLRQLHGMVPRSVGSGA